MFGTEQGLYAKAHKLDARVRNWPHFDARMCFYYESGCASCKLPDFCIGAASWALAGD